MLTIPPTKFLAIIFTLPDLATHTAL